MKIVIFGATGIVGNAIVNEALKKGHIVTVLTRDARKVTIKADNLHIIEGNVTDQNILRTALKEQDAVIQTLGIGGKGDGKPTFFVSETNKLIMAEMAQMGVKRLLAISVIGAGDSLTFLPWIYRKLVLTTFMKWFQAIIDDKNRMEASIINSNLDWTIVRCTTVKDCPGTGVVHTTFDGKGIKFSIAAEDMATFMVEQLKSDCYIKKTPTISN